MSKTRLMTAATLGVAGLMLSGCGSAAPGVAVKVGDQELSVREVDATAANYCTAISQSFEAGQVYPMSQVRQYVLQLLTVRSQALQIADDYGVEPGSTYQNDVAQRQGTAGVLPEDVREDYVKISSTTALAQDILEQVGETVLEDNGVTDPTVDQASQAGLDVFNQWPDTHGIDIDPRYGVRSVDGVLTPVDTNTSVAVGETAKAGIADEQDPSFAKSLPSTQRCG